MNLNSNFIKFTLDIKDPNLTFIYYCYKFFHGIKCKMYVAVLDISLCSQCGSTNFVKNGHYKSYIRYITANASNPVLIKIFKQRILCRNYHDNTPEEIIFNSVKRTTLNRLKINSLEEMKDVLKEYVYWFNNIRRSNKLKYTTPVKYRNRVLSNI